MSGESVMRHDYGKRGETLTMSSRVASRLSVFGTLLLTACAGLSTNSIPPQTTDEITRQILERTSLRVGRELRLMLIEYPPGASAPAHQHPVAGLCLVLEGEAESQYEDEGLVSIGAGESYQDSGTKTHFVWRNPSETEWLRFVCAADIGVDEAFATPVQ